MTDDSSDFYTAGPDGSQPEVVRFEKVLPSLRSKSQPSIRFNGHTAQHAPSLKKSKSVIEHRRPTEDSLKLPSAERLCCFYCREWYEERNNQRGSCREAPEPLDELIKTVTCYRCYLCCVYCCNRDDDGEMPSETKLNNGCLDRHNWRQTVMLLALSIIMPCLCCYLPLRAAGRCCSTGAKHRACPEYSKKPMEHQHISTVSSSSHAVDGYGPRKFHSSSSTSTSTFYNNNEKQLY